MLISGFDNTKTASVAQMSPYTNRPSRAWKHAQLMAAANQKTAPQLQNLSATSETHEPQRMSIYIYISAPLAQHNLICAQSTSTGRQQKTTTTCSATLPTRRDVCSRPRLSSNAAHSDLTHCSCRSERQSQPNTGVPLTVIHLYTSSKEITN